MQDLSNRCKIYPTDARFTLLVQDLGTLMMQDFPYWCTIYSTDAIDPTNARFNQLMLDLPNWCQIYPTDAKFTLLMQDLPFWCKIYTTDARFPLFYARFILLMQNLPLCWSKSYGTLLMQDLPRWCKIYSTDANALANSAFKTKQTNVNLCISNRVDSLPVRYIFCFECDIWAWVGAWKKTFFHNKFWPWTPHESRRGRA